MSANYASDGVDVNGSGESGGKELAVSPDLGLSRSEEEVGVYVERSDAMGQEVGVIGNGDLVSLSNGEPLPAEEETNSFADAESSETIEAHQVYNVAVGEVDDGAGEVILDNHIGKPVVVEMPASVDQAIHENGILVNVNKSMQDHSHDENVYEDASKDEMFVDAPDHMTAVDGRGSDVGEFKAMVETTQDDSEKEIDVQMVSGENQSHHQMDDLALLHAQLDKAIAEKELLVRDCSEYKEEREMFAREICNFHHQLQVLSDQYSLLGESHDGLVDRLRRAEKESSEVRTVAIDMPLHVMVSECSEFTSLLKCALDEKLQSEGMMRELDAVLFTKDQEIEELNAKVMELSVSCDVVLSYMDSLHNMWDESLKESAGTCMHLEDFTDRLLASLGSVVPQDDVSHDSVTERISLVEKSTKILIENYTQFLSEINHLGQCLAEVSSDFTVPQEKEFGSVFDVAREELLEQKRKELDHLEKLKRLEEDNQKLLEEIDKAKERLDEVNADAKKTKTELEQTESKLASAKEKLSMAVTKGKALVQQRDSLRQSLNEKNSELEKCLLELHQKSSALEAAEVNTEEMIKSQSLVNSLQESLLERNMVLQELEELMFQTNSPEEIQSLLIIDKVRWLVNQKSILEGIFLESRKVKDALSSIDLPESVSSAELESQINWLGKSFAQAKDDIIELKDQLASTLEAVALHESELSKARKEMDNFTGSLLEEKLEKDSLRASLEDLTCKYEGIVEKLSLVSSEKDGLMTKLLEFSGTAMDDQGFEEPSSNPDALIEKCIGNIREIIAVSSESALVEKENFQRLQSLLYVRDQELMLCKKMLEEEMFDRSEMASLSNELRRVSEEIVALKTERDSLQKDLERAEEKSSLIREKLSMAVKKGKGLVQEREGFKLSLEEKNTEIEKLKCELQQQESAVNEFKDQIKRLSSDLECIPKLESDTITMKEQKDQIEKLLLESNNRLQTLVHSIERTSFPTNIVFEDPVEKVKWLSEFIRESQVAKTRTDQELVKAKEEVDLQVSKLADACATIKLLKDGLSQSENIISVLGDQKKDAEVGKTHAEKELDKAKEEADLQASKLADAYATIKSLEDALSQAENNISILGDEKKDAEVGKTHAEKELEKAKEEAGLQARKLADARAMIKSLEDALSEAEKNISILGDARTDTEVGKRAVEQELEKVKEEAGMQYSKLADAYATIKSLEVALSESEKNISMLGDAREDAQVGKVSVEQELEKAKQEAESQASKLADACATIKSLKDALEQAENKVSVLSDEKEEAQSKSKQEITALSAKLAACMEELAASNVRIENQSSELVCHLNHLQILMKDKGLLSLLNESFKRKYEGMRNMNLLLQSIREQFATKGSSWPQFHPGTEKDPHATKYFPLPQFEDQNGTVVNNETSTADLVNSIPSYLPKIVEGFNAQYKLLGEKIEGFSSSLDEQIAYLLPVLQTTKDDIIHMLELMESLKLNVNDLEACNQAQENQISTLKNSTSILLSACVDATQELHNEVNNNALDPKSMPDPESLNYSLYSRSREADNDAMEEHCDRFGASKCVKAADDLLLALGRVRAQSKQLENAKSIWLTTVEDLQNKLKESTITAENAIKDRDLNLNKVSKLDGDLEALNNYCNEWKLKVEDCQAKEEKLREKESELSSLHSSLAKKEEAAEKGLWSADQVETLFDKVNKMEIISEESEADSPDRYFAGPVHKLFYIIDSYAELQHTMKSLTHDKGELQSTLAAQVREIEQLRKEAETLIINNQDLERKRWDLDELTMGLDKIIEKLGGNDSVEDTKSVGVKGLLPVLEKLVIALILECENSKSKSQELGTKLHEKQTALDALSARVKLLEDSLHDRPASSDTVQERSIFEASSLATGSEISEIEDGPLGKNSIPPAPIAAHVRTLRKGSSDHLALNIDLETDRLINHHESEDKGHVFKSLNTSGLIPKQGKLIADKIDGIWVSGGRILMSRPGARIGLIGYLLLLHIWVLSAIL
ncbi:trans-Golgi network-localized SYP41-interacting protein 1 isoform X2 [Magnolia sinica]|uniref:trans-Golgi network-localized SYP41-interacting protein 1 isoform X2 n=1 Tax=Magnolia sinica TaxID=86752 RepID=UPI002659D4E4|nr:trans-Golgi network-localized SYP41-interacting protein 1 isoform X2 [Magnolia sinica]